ncbi:MAG: lysozyme inhibitor LprI family protein [Gallionella sp.]|jgi:uncharacterized protein
MKQIFWMVLGWLLLASAQAASFDCGKAQSKVEHLICDNPEISKLDDDLSASYNAALQDQAQAKAIKQEQKQWLKERDICSDADCLEMVYRDRIADLNPEVTEDRFIPILSKDKQLCDAYKHYVEHEVATSNQHIHYASPMCQRNFGEAFPEFTTVKWREIKPEDYPELAVQAYLYLNFWPWSRPEVATYFAKGKDKLWLDTIKSNYKYNWWHMWLGEADIGNTGHMKTLLRVEDGRCGEPSMTGRPPIWSIPVMVVDASGKGIDTTKSEWILGVTTLTSADKLPPNLRDRAILGLHSTLQSTFDSFIFSEKTFFDRWEDEWPIPNSYLADQRYSRVTIYTISQEKPHLVCRFKFDKPTN